MTLTDRREPTVERSITVNACVVRWGNDGVGLQFVLQTAGIGARGRLLWLTAWFTAWTNSESMNSFSGSGVAITRAGRPRLSAAADRGERSGRARTPTSYFTHREGKKRAKKTGEALHGASQGLACGTNLCVRPTIAGQCNLVNANVARAGFDPHRGAAAVQLAGDVVVVLRALRQYLPVGVNTARTGFGVQRERRVAGPELHAARTGLQMPGVRRRPATLMLPEPVSARNPPRRLRSSILPDPVSAFTSPWPVCSA